MTPLPRCSHEPVCTHLIQGWPDYGCDKKDCQFDTRRPPNTPAAPDAPRKTWENCRQHVTCPDGEDCWYLSDDYHNDEKATIHNETLDAVLNKLRVAIGERTWIDSDGERHLGALTMEEIEVSLRTQSTQEQP
jgi:hypothetical protein